jgi:ATP phosphoribosyltransferase
MRELLQSAERVLIPKGDDNQACRDAFEIAADIEIPTFKDEELFVTSDGRKFWLVKSRDIPGFIESGYGDVGITGTDVIYEYEAENRTRLSEGRRRRLGDEAMCRFSLLAREDSVGLLERLIGQTRTSSLDRVVTSKPLLFDMIAAIRDYPLVSSRQKVSGSVEGAVSLMNERFAADVVKTGETARQNGLTEVVRLLNIYPEAVLSAEASNEAAK